MDSVQFGMWIEGDWRCWTFLHRQRKLIAKLIDFRLVTTYPHILAFTVYCSHCSPSSSLSRVIVFFLPQPQFILAAKVNTEYSIRFNLFNQRTCRGTHRSCVNSIPSHNSMLLSSFMIVARKWNWRSIFSCFIFTGGDRLKRHTEECKCAPAGFVANISGFVVQAMKSWSHPLPL